MSSPVFVLPSSLLCDQEAKENVSYNLPKYYVKSVLALFTRLMLPEFIFCSQVGFDQTLAAVEKSSMLAVLDRLGSGTVLLHVAIKLCRDCMQLQRALPGT